MLPKHEIPDHLKGRIDDIIQLVYEIANGNFEYRLPRYGFNDELDGLVGGINMLGEELKSSMVSKNYLESIYKGVVDVLFILDIDFRIEEVNEITLEKFNCEESALLKRPLAELLSENEQILLERVRAELGEKNICRINELHFCFNGELSKPHSATFSYLLNSQNQPSNILLIAKDVSVFKEARERAEASNEAKTRFLANMSHEIRTPLSAILGFIDLMFETSPTEEQQNFLRLIKASGEDLSKLINNILDINKIEAGKLTLEQIEFQFEEIMKSNLNPYRYLAREKGIDLSISIDPAIPKVLIGDPQKINQIVRNLVSNAVKFTVTGNINVNFTSLPAKAGYAVIQGDIIDSGIGIPSNKLNVIFDSFTQADDSTSRNYGGSGLGLTICRYLLNSMDGDIKVESPPVSFGFEKGTAFTFTMELKAADSQVVKPREEAQTLKLKFSRQYHILVVDDNDLNLKLAKRVLENLGAKALVADSGQSALELINIHDFDLVFIDIHMPEMDGYELAAKIRKMQYNMPLIALSADAYEEAVLKSLQSGMNAHVKKPFTKEEIFVASKGFLEL
ncbi:response regulator [Imperialibacter roseus]|uniref:histidine kinase n=1 Tax=Imperialibacter roseus TaxID=1324217 RepID=A0ABZ0IWL8_9BACT|nr:response regulator [Imperialibacter roseus]WOK08320.1 response regulator [Imperialibacter roseus]|tara:strand:+ start:23758 stop:25455 length:1698 start_codon:yes stop_codon:yes gene_type:complete